MNQFQNEIDIHILLEPNSANLSLPKNSEIEKLKIN